jgi:hypothetical protein
MEAAASIGTAASGLCDHTTRFAFATFAYQ